MTVNLIAYSNKKEVSPDIVIAEGEFFTLRGHSLNGSPWGVTIEAKLSNGVWIKVDVLSFREIQKVFTGAGTYRVVKEERFDVMIDRG